MFSILPISNFKFLESFILSSADAFNLDQSRILSFGKELSNYKTILCFNDPDAASENIMSTHSQI